MSEAARFWSKVVKTESGCWLWAGQKNNKGYGRYEFWHDGSRQRVLAHRLACALVGAPIPAELVARHICDTPACVRPDHIDRGTQAENIGDAVRRERMDTTGLTRDVMRVCNSCGVTFTGQPNRRYCDAHRPKVSLSERERRALRRAA